jgi:hypothetical protein
VFKTIKRRRGVSRVCRWRCRLEEPGQNAEVIYKGYIEWILEKKLGCEARHRAYRGKQSTLEVPHAEKYTFGDVCCGAGGASCGALEAGLAVRLGIDNDKLAFRSYVLNSLEPDATCIQGTVIDFDLLRQKEF